MFLLSEFGTLIVGYNLFAILIIRQQPSNTVNTHWLSVTADAWSALLWQ
jgi:hypothetical protein